MNNAEKIRKSPKRIVLDVEDDFHKEIKQKALDRNMPVRSYVLQAIWARLVQDRNYD